jgi:hypothetical protein
MCYSHEGSLKANNNGLWTHGSVKHYSQFISYLDFDTHSDPYLSIALKYPFNFDSGNFITLIFEPESETYLFHSILSNQKMY